MDMDGSESIQKETAPLEKKKFQNIIITKEEKDKFGEQTLRINHGRLRRILLQPDIGNKPVAFITITGCKRTGKSFILNYVLRYLRHKGWQNPDWMGDADTKADKETDIEWKQSTKRHTTGIRIFEEKFEVPIGKNRTMIVMIMDTQGLFDFKTPEQMNKAILTLSTMLSSVQIFNVMRHIDAQHVQYLETCVDFAQETSKQQYGSGYLKLERLMFLVRDHPEDHENDDIVAGFKSTYSLEYGDDILKEIFESEDGGKHQVEVRKKIKKTFENVGCFPLPYPGRAVDKKGFAGANNALDKEFLDAVKSFVEEIAHPSRLIPKRSRSRNLTAREILNTIAGCDTLFADKMFEASMMVTKNVEGYYASECQEAISEYVTILEQRLIEAGGDKEKRARAEKETRLHALRRYDSAPNMGPENIRKKYRTDLQLNIGHHYKNAIERYKCRRKLQKNMLKEFTRAAIQEYSRLMEDQLCQATESSSLDGIHNSVVKRIETSLGEKINAAKFRSQASEILQRSRDAFAQTMAESITSKKNERDNELFLLVQLTLRDECEDQWNKVLITYAPESELGQHKNAIDEQVTEKFWSNAVNPTEYKYIRLLYAKMEMAKCNAKQEAGWSTQGADSVEDDNPSEGEQSYAEKVNELISDFSKKVRTGIQKHAENSEEYQNFESEIDGAIEKEFYGFCNADWNPALDKLEHMLDNEYVKARMRHKKLWDDFKETVHLCVDAMVLDHENQFHENMNDKHIEQGDFKIYYDEAMTFAKEYPAEALEQVRVSKSAKEYYDAVVEEKMIRSRMSLEEKNARNKEMRPIRECSSPPPKETGFHKLLGWLRVSKSRR